MPNMKQPIELIIANGKKHLTKDEIAERRATEIRAPADNIKAPSYLTKKQKEEFYNIAEQLIDLKIMSNLDCDALARYITSLDLYIKISKKLRTKKVIDDIVLLEKYSSLQDKYFKQCRAVGNDLGLSITSRCKLVVPKPEETPKENKFKKKFG